MGPTEGYVFGILNHFGNYSRVLAEWAQPGAFHDADMLVAGAGVNDEVARTQFALYSILAVPLIMGNDVRALTAATRALLLNGEVIRISQDALGRAGVMLTPTGAAAQVWMRPLLGGDVAVAAVNVGPASAHAWHTACAPQSVNTTTGGYWSSRAPPREGWCIDALGSDTLDWYCCNTDDCAGTNFSATTGAGCLLPDLDGGFIAGDASVSGWAKVGWAPPTPSPSFDITVQFADVGLYGLGQTIRVLNVFDGTTVDLVNATSWTARNVPWQGTTLVRMTTLQG